MVNSDRAGRQLDISVKIKSPIGKLIQYFNRKVEDQWLGYVSREEGDYEICFNNRFSMLESKRVFWQFEVEGQFDEEAFKKKIVNATIEYAKEQAKEVEGVMRKVRKNTILKSNKKKIDLLIDILFNNRSDQALLEQDISNGG